MEHSSSGDDARDVLASLGFVGFWEADFKTGVARASPAIDRLFGLAPAPGNAERPLQDYDAGMRLDFAFVCEERPRCVDPSGIGMLEYRVVDASGQIRWVLCRARYRKDPDGTLREGRGVIFDITASKSDEASPRMAPLAADTALHRLTDLALEAYGLSKQVGDPGLSRALETVLMATGWLLSRDVKGAGDPNGIASPP